MGCLDFVGYRRCWLLKACTFFRAFEDKGLPKQYNKIKLAGSSGSWVSWLQEQCNVVKLAGSSGSWVSWLLSQPNVVKLTGSSGSWVSLL